MMYKIVPIVEGEGDVKAFPILLRKLIHEKFDRYDFEVMQPLNTHTKFNIVKQRGLEKFVQHAENKLECDKTSEYGGIVILLDADKDCPKKLAIGLAKRISTKYPTVVVVANKDYEAWFLPFISTMAGQKISGRLLIKAGLSSIETTDGQKGKSWIEANDDLSSPYNEPDDQPPLTELIDISNAALKKMRSFKRLEDAIEELILAVDARKSIVTPL